MLKENPKLEFLHSRKFQCNVKQCSGRRWWRAGWWWAETVRRTWSRGMAENRQSTWRQRISHRVRCHDLETKRTTFGVEMETAG